MLRQVTKSRRLVRYFASDAKEDAAKSISTPAPIVVKKGGSSFMQRIMSFGVGVAVGAGYGLYVLSEDVEESTQQIQHSVGNLKDEMIAQNASLTKRIEALEKRQ
ncbi:uncharacterized protein PHALS_03616 [Plasmopara halstedii]|uniref:Uncharacterized protein n=1 Tax=Plasmopara halstedii TaxID=4781 RepID=A0A0N7L7F7_PLAHL|nr:uncharacterized protein PHALS_03616 [Plasmopara halstedii]CEG46947.1 hypothetical protein PHALS_03616 [Plasmopara halstedii]|eukprot:XP_024583316.1 hypothetical protein PHALS_03616 [Plasmopara halstedii]